MLSGTLILNSSIDYITAENVILHTQHKEVKGLRKEHMHQAIINSGMEI